MDTVTKNLKKKDIILVENDLLNIDVMVKYIEGTYNCTVANTAMAAESALRNNHFDLMLLDIHLGDGVGGLGLLERIKMEERYAKLPIIAVTAFAAEYQRDEILKAGCHEYLAKPFYKNDLLQIIDKVLKCSQMG